MTERKKLGVTAPPPVIKGEAVADLESAGFEMQYIAANHGPTYEFWGRLLGEYSTNNNGRKSKWTELRLWETPSGKWVTESAGCSDEPGQVDILDASVVNGELDGRPMEFQAMDFWKWSSPAKALAKRLGWDLTVKVD